MNRLQKRAWVNLIMMAIMFVYVAIRFFVLADGLKEVESGFAGLLTYLFVAGLCVLQPLLSRKKDQVHFDERDRLINYRAILGTYTAFWLLILPAFLFPWFVLGSDDLVSVHVLRILLAAIAIILLLVYSILILVQYDWGGKDNE